ncbi:MAG TPA: histidine phosphatase family protein [Bryobacteraceae bacterium]|nr:histidine phosphatase family protein [Bryobacteraceae bacterium]
MSRIYLVRHGQAGTRKAYDSLSDLGRRQASLLGEYFVAEGIRFAAAYRGVMRRQEQTGAEVKGAYDAAGIPFPDIELDHRWNEFDLDHIYRTLAPKMCAEDPEFKRAYDDMVAQARAAEQEHGAGVNRRWLPCDMKIVEAWLHERHPYEGESWKHFRERVTASRADLAHLRKDDDIVIFTSATPIGIWTALTMEVTDHRAMKLAGAVQNASFTVIRLHDEQLRLHTFNAIPHLTLQEYRTYR